MKNLILPVALFAAFCGFADSGIDRLSANFNQLNAAISNDLASARKIKATLDVEKMPSKPGEKFVKHYQILSKEYRRLLASAESAQRMGESVHECIKAVNEVSSSQDRRFNSLAKLYELQRSRIKLLLDEIRTLSNGQSPILKMQGVEGKPIPLKKSSLPP